MSKVAVLSGPERRRRWTTAEKRRMVEESLAPGASVIEVALRHDVHPNLLTVWRRQARTGAFGPAPASRQEARGFRGFGLGLAAGALAAGAHGAYGYGYRPGY